MMMRILLVNPPTKDALIARRDAPPLGIAYLAACLRREGFQVALLDANVGGEPAISASAICERALAEAYDLVGISATTEGFRASLALVDGIKRARPNTTIVYGGHHATATHRELVERYPLIDVVVRGEGEYTLCELAKRLGRGQSLRGLLGTTYRENGAVVVEPPRPAPDDLDSLPFPARDLLPPSEKYASNYDFGEGGSGVIGTIVSSRGCPYSCSFCSVHSFFAGCKRKWRARSPGNVVDEIEELIDRYGAEYIGFVDDNFFVDAERTVEIFRELERRGRSITFSFATRADQVIRGKKHITALRAAGCRRIELGLESGSDSVLKRFNKGVSVGQNDEAISIIRQTDIILKCDVIMFDPDTTIEELSETLDFMKRNDLSGQYPPLFYTFLGLLPGTDYLVRMAQSGRAGDAVAGSPPWECADERTAAVFSAVRKFFHRYQTTLDLVVSEFEDMFFSIRAKMNELSGHAPERKTLEQISTQCYLHSAILKRKPYQFFEQLLDAARNGRSQALPYEELAEKMGGQIEAARSNLLALRQALGRRQPAEDSAAG